MNMTLTHPTDLNTPPRHRLPIFVYGTLRPGHGLARVWTGRASALHDGTAQLAGFRLTTNGAFPYAVVAVNAVTTGTLIVPDPEAYDDLLAELDHIEGYPHHYDRLMVKVSTPDGETVAWVYAPNDQRHGTMRAVPGNDWNEWSRS